MKIATWNVNGIRARAGRGRRVRRARAARRALPAGDQGDAATRFPRRSASSAATGATGTAPRATRASRCTCARSIAAERAAFTASRLRRRDAHRAAPRRATSWSRRSTCRTAARTFRRRSRFLEALEAYVAALRATGERARALRRPQRRAHRARRAPEGAQDRRRSASAPTSARCFERILDAGAASTSAATLDPDNDGLFTWWAPWRNMRQRNIGWRLDYVLASDALAARTSRCVSMREVGTSDHAPVVATFARPPRRLPS